MTERLFLLDGTALAYRSHFAFMRAQLTDLNGRPTGAVYGFVARSRTYWRRDQGIPSLSEGMEA